MHLKNNLVKLKHSSKLIGTGWLPSVPDLRDYHENHDEVAEFKKALNIASCDTSKPLLSATMDLTSWCSPIENQGSIGSCTAHAAAGIVEYFQKRAYGKHIDGSRLFVYKTTRNLMGVTGDTGAWLRTTMGALTLCGIPPERYWEYTDIIPNFDVEPTSFVYSVADNFEAIRYFCHDPQSLQRPYGDVLKSVKIFVAHGIPSMFGFWGYDSFEDSSSPGDIPLPHADEPIKWGHAVVIVGYDDNKVITNTRYNIQTTGAFKIRNSWGLTWGDEGYGWIPYEYALKGLAMDFWSLFDMEWINTRKFGL